MEPTETQEKFCGKNPKVDHLNLKKKKNSHLCFIGLLDICIAGDRVFRMTQKITVLTNAGKENHQIFYNNRRVYLSLSLGGLAKVSVSGGAVWLDP